MWARCRGLRRPARPSSCPPAGRSRRPARPSHRARAASSRPGCAAWPGGLRRGDSRSAAWGPPPPPNKPPRPPALEVRTRAAHRVRIDHHARVAERDMLAAGGSQHGLVVDAGVGHAHAKPLEGADGAALQFEHPVGLAQVAGLAEIGAARIVDGGNAHAALLRIGQPLQPLHAGLAESFGVGHDVRLRDGHEVFRAEEIAHRDLVPEGRLRDDAQRAAEDGLFFIIEDHGAYSRAMPALRTATLHLAVSDFWNSASGTLSGCTPTLPSLLR